MEVTMAGALNAALRDSMREDDCVVVYGEDVGRLGGVFRITDGLQTEMGADRCFDTPVAESGIVGTAIGMALYGMRPVVEMQFDGFSYPALNQVISHVAKYRSRTRGRVGLPLVIRIPYGGGIGAVEHHSESPEAYYAHTAGLDRRVPGDTGGRVCAPSRVHRLRRPGDLSRAQAPVLAQGGSRPPGDRSTNWQGDRAAPGNDCDSDRLWADGHHGDGGGHSGRGGERARPRGHRRPDAVAARYGDTGRPAPPRPDAWLWSTRPRGSRDTARRSPRS